MNYFLDRFLKSSSTKWWKLFAAVCIGAFFGWRALLRDDKFPVLYGVAGGGALGLLGGLFLLWYDSVRDRKRPPVTITAAVARTVREIAAEQQFDLAKINLVVGRGANGLLSMEIVDDPTLRTTPGNVVVAQHGLMVVIPGEFVATCSGLTVDVEGDGFRFRTPDGKPL